jgi:hypothetical protein
MKMTESILTQPQHPAGSDCVDDYRPFLRNRNSPRFAVAPSSLTVDGFWILLGLPTSPSLLSDSDKFSKSGLPVGFLVVGRSFRLGSVME